MDAIGRSALLRQMDKYIEFVYMDDQVYHAMCVVAEYIKDAPTLDVVPVVHGHIVWRDRQRGGVKKVTGVDEFGVERTVKCTDFHVERTPYCSVCGKILGDTFLTYCSACGARMDAKGE